MAQTTEEKKESRRLAQIRYRATVKGRAAVKKYNNSDSHKRAQKKYSASEKGIVHNTSHLTIIKKKEYNKKYRARNRTWLHDCARERRCGIVPFTKDEWLRRQAGEKIPPVNAKIPPNNPILRTINNIRKQKRLKPIMSLDEYGTRKEADTLYNK